MWFKLEPPIVAVCARGNRISILYMTDDLQDAASTQQLLDTARQAGLKKCSVTGLRDRWMIVLVDTQRIETLVAEGGKLLVSQEYLMRMIAVANAKLAKSRKRMEALQHAIEQLP